MQAYVHPPASFSPRCKPLTNLPHLPLPPLLPAVIAGLLAAEAAHAQLLANMTAPTEQRPVLLYTASGTPQIDIARPGAAGVSVNQFRQFDVDQRGAVVNNGRVASQTAIAGWVAANPALLNGEARVIVNEVRSNQPSLLRGYVEIAGGNAELIIANPSGIHCNTCGFIHASRVELATARPMIENGKLTGYAMGNGALEIAGGGLDASRVDALSLLTQAARVNAGIWANELKLELKAASTTSDALAAPSFALDVAKVGGMYANRIWLVGSALGLGVRNAGNWSASDTLTVSIDGKLENSAGIDARDVRMQATTVDNVAQGKILGEHVTIQADRIANAGHPDASPVLAAAADVDLATHVLENTEQAMIFAGADLRIGGQLDSKARASGEAGHVLNRAASIESLGSMDIGASRLENLNAGVVLAETLISGPERLTYVQPYGETRKYLPEELKAAGFADIFRYSRTEYIVDRTEFGSQVVSSKPSRILSGGNLRLTGMEMLNENSQIMVAGELTGTLDGLRTLETLGSGRIHETGTSQFIAVRPIFNFAYKVARGPILPYAPADTVWTERLPLAVTVDHQTGKLPAPGFDVAGNRLAADRNSLFHIHAGTGPLLVTDPRFTRYRQWLNSDVMLAQLGQDPERLLKRIGDGYIEQRMVREQIALLTGRRLLPGQDNDEAQFAALMNSGVQQATVLQLQPGIALTAAQVAKLTSDIVWLVEQEIRIPARDGQPEQTMRVLVPRVYLLPRAGDLDGSGSLMSAQRVALAVADAIDNAGTINGAEGLQLQARTISNRGKLSGDRALLIASDDINLPGGEVSTRHQQQLQAGRDIRITSSTHDSSRQSATAQATSAATRTHIDRAAMLHVADRGDLQMLAGRDIVLDAAHVLNRSSGNIDVVAGRDLTLGVVTTRSTSSASARGSANFLSESQRTDVGTAVQAHGSIVMAAGQDLATRAASVDAGAGVVLSAERNLAVTAGESRASFAQGTESHTHDLFGASTSIRRTASEQTDALASAIGGKLVELRAGQDLRIAGSDVSSDHATRLQAGRDASIAAATESTLSESFRRETRSGVFSGPGLAIGIGNQKQQNTSTLRSTRQRGSEVGALAGDVRIEAGDSYRQQASRVAAPSGSVTIAATDVDVAGGADVSDVRQTSSLSQSGLSITLSNPLVDAGQTLENLGNASKQTRSRRAQLLAAAASGLAVASAAKEVAGDPQHAGGVTLAVTIGSSKSESTATEHATRVVPSVLAASGNVDIAAQGRPDATLAISGSRVSAGDSVRLTSDGELDLDAQASTDSQSMSSHSSSTGTGVAISIGKQGTGMGIIANASKANGEAASVDRTWTNTEISAGRVASLHSEGNSRLRGAIVQAPTIDARVGGDLLIESLQDSSRYDSKQQSLSGSFTLPLAGGSPSAQFNTSKSGIHSTYLSTTEASGLQAGDGGFQVDVSGKADLRGAAIASTEAAVKAGANQFSSGELAMSDLKNEADYDARAYGAGIGIGRNPQGDYAPRGHSAGLGNEHGHQSSVTTAGISGIAGNQSIRTGDASTGLGKIFDAEKVAREINAQVIITQEFSGQAYKAVDDHVNQRRIELNKALNAAKEAKDGEAERSINTSLYELRREEQVMNILIGAVIGMGGSAVTKEGLSAAAEKMRALMIDESRKFKGITDGTIVLSNTSGQSEGVQSDGVKLGGTRIDLDFLCGKSNERCAIQKNPDGSPTLDANGKTQLALDANGMVQFDKDAANMSLHEFLNTEEGKKMFGPTGGIQGFKGTLFGVPYEAGSWQDKLIESFSGVHDLIGGRLVGLYDENGNIKRGMTDGTRYFHDKFSAVAIIPSTPFAASVLLPPSVWEAITVFLKSSR